jgi:Fumarylacetoacetate (FAA) hydrolase family
VPAESLDLLGPVTAPARIVAQAVNYRSHAIESGFDPDKVPPIFSRKSSHSLTGPSGDIIRPDGVGFLDYEVELGLVIGADLPWAARCPTPPCMNTWRRRRRTRPSWPAAALSRPAAGRCPAGAGTAR